jgi:hypothetical protein
MLVLHVVLRLRPQLNLQRALSGLKDEDEI